MLYNVYQVCVIDWVKLCHVIRVGFRWTKQQYISRTWYSALTDCLIFWILAVKNDANSLQALVDRCSEATGTGGFVSLLTVANKAQAFFLFLVGMSEKKDYLDFFKIC